MKQIIESQSINPNLILNIQSFLENGQHPNIQEEANTDDLSRASKMEWIGARMYARWTMFQRIAKVEYQFAEENSVNPGEMYIYYNITTENGDMLINFPVKVINRAGKFVFYPATEGAEMLKSKLIAEA